MNTLVLEKLCMQSGKDQADIQREAEMREEVSPRP